MKFHYDCTKGKREIIGTPEDVIQVDHKRVGFINRNPFLLNVEVRQEDTLQFVYNISGKTNYLAWQSEASAGQRQEMERKLSEIAEGFCTGRNLHGKYHPGKKVYVCGRFCKKKSI